MSNVQLIKSLPKWTIPYLKKKYTKIFYTGIINAFGSVPHKQLLKYWVSMD